MTLIASPLRITREVMTNNLAAIFRWLLCLLWLASTCTSAEPTSPIQATVAQWQTAMLQADLDAVMATISADYQGDDGLDRAGLRNFLHHALKQDQLEKLKIDIDDASIDVKAGQATVLPIRLTLQHAVEPLELELVLADEADAWRIVCLTTAGDRADPKPKPGESRQADREDAALKLLSLERRFVRAPGDSPRPQVDAEHVPLRTSLFMLIGSTVAQDRVLADSVSISLHPQGGVALEVLLTGQRFASGYDGQITRHQHRSFGESLLVFMDSMHSLQPDTTYTIRVQARSKFGAILADDEGVWSFSTEPSPTTHRLDYQLDVQSQPDVFWKGEFFNGFAKPSFATSTREGGRVPHYQMMAEARETYPNAWNLLRDAYLAGFEDQYNPFKAYPNIVRERETRRITAIDVLKEGLRLTVEDFFGHEQYGIASNRPLSGDYQVGDQILIADGIQSARSAVIAVDDPSRTVLVTPFDQPAKSWQLQYPRPLPTQEDPHSPGLFPPGGTYLRKFDPPGTAHYYWGRVDHEWDLLVKQFGFRVIPRFAGAPGDLSIDGRGGTTAKCLVQLHEVTREITRHLIERYGPATLDWPWVVLNEPDLMSLYWRNRDWEELQRFYDYSSDAILRAFEDQGYDSDQVRVGGLELGAIAGLNMRLEDFLTHVSPNAARPQPSRLGLRPDPVGTESQPTNMRAPCAHVTTEDSNASAPGALELNAAYADPRLAGRRSRRIEALCEANGGRGAPFDFLSIHTYNDSEMAAAKLIRAKGIRENWSTLNDVVRRIQVEDRSAVIAGPMFHFVNLLSTLRDDFRVFTPKQIGGHSVGGFASATEADLRILLYSHHGQDPQSRSDMALQIEFELIGIDWETIEILQYRIDRDNNSYYSLARKLRDRPGRPQDLVLSEDEFQEVAEQAKLQVTSRSIDTRDESGRVRFTAELVGNGVNFVIVRPVPKPE